MQATVQTIVEVIEYPDWLMYGVANIFQTVFGGAVSALDAGMRNFEFWNIAQKMWKANEHEFSKKLPLTHLEGIVFGIIAYFVVIGALYPIGQKIIGKLEFRSFMFCHNLFLFALSLYMGVTIGLTAFASGFPLWNVGVDVKGKNSWRMAKLINLFFLSKIPEFLDTVIMMVKQNYRQVSFLHMYHHASIFPIWGWLSHSAPGGDAYWSAMANSLIHVGMYRHYYLMAWHKDGPVREYLDKTKFRLTYAQILQFVLNQVQTVYLLFFVEKMQYPRYNAVLLFWYMLSLIALFTNFLLQNKGKDKGDGEKKKGGNKSSKKGGGGDDTRGGSEPRNSNTSTVDANESKKKK